MNYKDTLKRMINLVIVFTLAILVDIIVLRLATGQFFKVSLITLGFLFIGILVCLLKITPRTHYLESFLATCSMICVLFICNVFFPIFIDRSVSYHLILASAQQPIEISQVESSRYTHQMYRARLEELEKLRLITVGPGQTVRATRFGKFFAGVMHLAAIVYALPTKTPSMEESSHETAA